MRTTMGTSFGHAAISSGLGPDKTTFESTFAQILNTLVQTGYWGWLGTWRVEVGMLIRNGPSRAGWGGLLGASVCLHLLMHVWFKPR